MVILPVYVKSLNPFSEIRPWIILNEKHCLTKDIWHGFIRKKSCLTNLLAFMEEVTNYFDSGYPVDVMYLDLQKAFNKVPLERLLMKLAAHGLGGDVLSK